MATYTATIKHHSSARVVTASTPVAAKRKATLAFRHEFADHMIVIHEEVPGRAPELMSSRRVGAHRWTDRPS